MAKLRFLGGPNALPHYAAHDFEVGPGEITPELTEERAAILLRDWPGAWERVEARSVDAPAHDRMKRKPNGKR